MANVAAADLDGLVTVVNRRLKMIHCRAPPEIGGLPETDVHSGASALPCSVTRLPAALSLAFFVIWLIVLIFVILNT